MRGLYSQQRIESLNDPWERLACAVIMQAVSDLRIPGCKKEIEAFFHGPLVGASGIDGDMLMTMAENRNRRLA